MATTFDQYVEVGGVALSSPAWEVLNVETLTSGPSVRGENRKMPGATGVRALRHRPSETARTLEMHVNGQWAPDGTAHTDPQQGIWDNWLTLRAQFDALLAAPGGSTTLMRLHLRGRVLSGDVQVLRYEVGNAMNASELPVTLEVNIVAGSLT